MHNRFKKRGWFLIACLFAVILAFCFIPSVTAVGMRPAYVKDTLLVDTRYDLKEKTLEVRKNSVILLRGKGYITNGILKGNNSQLVVEGESPAIDTNVRIEGLWRSRVVKDKWFDFNPAPEFDSYQLIKNILALTNDKDSCHIIMDANRYYYVKHPYKGAMNLGDKVRYTINAKGKKVRRYSDLFRDEFSFIRVFTIPSNTHFTIQNRIQLRGTSLGAYVLFWEYAKHDVTIDGHGCISGDLLEHPYDKSFLNEGKYYAEWGQVFYCVACDNVTFRDITVENAFGDCIIIGQDYWNDNIKRRHNSNFTLEGLHISRARRNGIAIGCKNCVIRNCIFESCGTKNVNGTAPKAAIDFEVDGFDAYPDNGNENVLMENCLFIGNEHDVSSTNNNAFDYGKVATTIRNCYFTAPLRFNATNWIKLENCHIVDIVNYSGKVTSKIPVRHIEFSNCNIERMPSLMKKSSWHNKFTNGTKVGATYETE